MTIFFQTQIVIVSLLKLGKLHFITLNYTLNYTLYHKLFECMFCTLNYDPYYTLHLEVKFAVNLDGKVEHHMKIPNCPSF